MRPVARAGGVAALVAVEILIWFGVGDPGDWAGNAIFAVVMLVPAALVGVGVAMIVEGVAHGLATRREHGG